MLQTLNPLKGRSPKVRAKPKSSSKKKMNSSKSSKKSKSAKSFVSPLSPLASGGFCKGLQKGVDEALMKLPPNLQSQIDQMMKALDKSSFNLQDLRTLGYRILKQATEVSEAIKETPLFTNPVHSFITKQKVNSPSPNKSHKSISKKPKKVLL